MKLSSILGLNARSRLFSYEYGTSAGRHIARSKILTKRVLTKHGIPTPQLYKVFKKFRDVLDFDWGSLPSSFALKPSKSFGGAGIIIVRKRLVGPPDSRTRLLGTIRSRLVPELDGGQASSWITTQGKRVNVEDLKLHTTEILEGAYSIGNVPDIAFCEEYVGRHKAFRKLAYRGTPDIRIIVFNKVPVMAMLRLPTRDSAGRANLHQGAIGVGIDIETGITTQAIWYGEPIEFKPETKRKLSGVRVPYWTRILEIAAAAAQACDLGYVGVDIVLHPEKGPQVLELNASPGLAIQLANMAGLRKRLERVEGLSVVDAEHGVKLSKALFSAHLSGRAKVDEQPTLGIVEEVKIRSGSGRRTRVLAKVDTGAARTAIDKKLAGELGLLSANNILWMRRFKSSMGREARPVIWLTFWLKGRKITTQAGVADRGRLSKKVIIGRRDLSGFLIEPGRGTND